MPLPLGAISPQDFSNTYPVPKYQPLSPEGYPMQGPFYMPTSLGPAPLPAELFPPEPPLLGSPFGPPSAPIPPGEWITVGPPMFPFPEGGEYLGLTWPPRLMPALSGRSPYGGESQSIEEDQFFLDIRNVRTRHLCRRS